MKLIYSLALISVLSVSTIAVQSKVNNDPLKPYTKCKVSGLKIMEVSRRPKSNPKHRTVKTANGQEEVSVLEGYTVMYSYHDMFYYFANVKIEQSDPARYEQDKERIVGSLNYFATTKQATPMIFAGKTMLNGFEHYGLDRDRIDVGGTVGTHVLFHDRHRLIVTVYLLNQDDRSVLRHIMSAPRKFNSIEEYRPLRDDFLAKYSECLAQVASAQP